MVRTRHQIQERAGSSTGSARSPSPQRGQQAPVEEPNPPPPQVPLRPDLERRMEGLEGVVRELIQEIRQPARAVPAVAPEAVPPPPPPVVDRGEVRGDIPAIGRGVPFAHHPEFRAIRKSFLEAQPPSFYGTRDTGIAESWLAQIKVAFRSIQCPEEYRVELVYPLLKDEALYWWDSVERHYPAGYMFTWEDFLREFADRHYSEVDRREKVAEFFSLKQGDMSIRDYEAKFHRLSRWVPEHVDTEAKKMDFFTQSLHPEIKAWVTITRPQTYQELIRCALDAESAEAEKK